LTLAVAFSGVHAAKTARVRAAYNRASRAVAEIVRIWREHTASGEYLSLADVLEAADASDLERAIRASPPREFAHEALVDRLRHFSIERDVFHNAVLALNARDWPGLANEVARSQRAAEQLLGNQTSETIELVRLALERGALASSAFGAGFGGSVWALVAVADAERFLDEWRAGYFARFSEPAARAEFFVSRPADAARFIA
jgi:galactokinase